MTLLISFSAIFPIYKYFYPCFNIWPEYLPMKLGTLLIVLIVITLFSYKVSSNKSNVKLLLGAFCLLLILILGYGYVKSIIEPKDVYLGLRVLSC